MATITDFAVVGDDGYPLAADPHGDNVALRCMSCGGPVLAVIRDHQRGSSPDNPARCRGCGCRYWVEAIESASQLIVHRVRPA